MLVIWSIKNVGVGWGGGGLKKNFFRPHIALKIRVTRPPGPLHWICHWCKIQNTTTTTTTTTTTADYKIRSQYIGSED